jgi:hypothetical protein
MEFIVIDLTLNRRKMYCSDCLYNFSGGGATKIYQYSLTLRQRRPEQTEYCLEIKENNNI